MPPFLCNILSVIFGILVIAALLGCGLLLIFAIAFIAQFVAQTWRKLRPPKEEGPGDYKKRWARQRRRELIGNIVFVTLASGWLILVGLAIGTPICDSLLHRGGH